MTKVKRKGAEKVAWRDVKTLKEYSNNARIHSDEQVQQIAKSIKQFGFNSPILIDGKGGVIAGHGRLQAARSLGMKTVPVVVLGHLTKKQKRAYILADNRIGENAQWNDAILNLELKAIQIDDVSMDGLGFSDADLARLLTFADTPTDPESEWRGMPQFDQKDKGPFRTIAVHFTDQEAVDSFATKLGKTITPKTQFVWLPEHKIEKTVGTVYKGGK